MTASLTPSWYTKTGGLPDPVSRHGAPLSFASHAEGLLPGQTVVMDMKGLQNGYRTPYYIDEIRMQAYQGTAAASANRVWPGYGLSFQFRVGQHAMSMVPIPMLLHQPQYNGLVNEAIGLYTGNLSRAANSARWLLAKPLYMEPGDVIQCNAVRNPTIAAGDGTNPFTIDVCYVGRSLPPGTKGPAERNVPWIASYVHDFANAYSQTTQEFRSPFLNKQLHVHRFVGRPLNKAGSVATNTVFGVNTLQMPDGTKYAAVEIEDSQGYKITRHYVPVGLVFDPLRCAWTFNRPLGPREQYNLKFQTLGTVGGANIVFGTAMLGYREEA